MAFTKSDTRWPFTIITINIIIISSMTSLDRVCVSTSGRLFRLHVCSCVCVRARAYVRVLVECVCAYACVVACVERLCVRVLVSILVCVLRGL